AAATSAATAAAKPTAAATSAATAAAKPTPVKFNWLFGFTIQANPSMPIIVAKEKGYYAEQGIDITWDFTTTSAGIRLIGTGQYHAGSVSDARSVANFVKEGIPLKVVAQQGQDTARGFASRKGENLTNPKSWVGKKVGIKGGEPWTEYLALMSSNGIDRKQVTEVPIGFSSVELKEKIIDILPVFLGNEPYHLRENLKQDIDLTIPKAHGFDTVGTVMVANTQFVQQNRAGFLRFLKATMKGQEFMADVKNRSEIIQMAVQYGGTATTRGAHEYIYNFTLPDLAHASGVGWIDKARWQKDLDVLKDLKLVTDVPTLDRVVDDTLIKEVLKDGKVIWP
ncbi:MAG: ABC transporter substrate-binding protein, partial [Chloroflexi bacterium]|nr:ABC transporter substrate-binding protein [Chloroflexota bacterium]